jgi:predicted RNA-binding Zn-ribbon protein involved in translation (DUF1610 family)
MNIPATTWRTDDPCPACGTALTLTGSATGSSRQDCPACGWAVTWDGDADD